MTELCIEYYKIFTDGKNALKNIKDFETYIEIVDSVMFSALLNLFDGAKEQSEELFACKTAITELLPIVEKLFLAKTVSHDDLDRINTLYKRVYAFCGRRSLEHFIEYMEWERTSHNKILYNRKDVLKPYVYYLNKATFDKNIKYVVASFPPSYGKTFILNYYSAWLYGIKFNTSILRLSYSEDLVNSCSRSIKELLSSDLFSDIFPNFKMYKGRPFAKEKESDWQLKGADVLVSHISRTRDGAITGVRANTMIAVDDITKGSEEATNAKVHQDLYKKWTTEWWNRRTDSNVLFVLQGTMWSPEDILNKIVEDIEKYTDLIEDSKMKFTHIAKDGSAIVIRVPLLDENDECTCEHVMSTKEALQLREKTDEYLFSCVYQQSPIAPTGLEFAKENLQYYKDFPDTVVKDVSYATLDPARKGKDYVSMPIAVKDAEDNYYFKDILYKKNSMSELYDLIVQKIIDNNVIMLVLENNTDTSLKMVLETKLKEQKYFLCDIVEKYNTEVKEKRIADARGIIKRKMVFKDPSLYSRSSDYFAFMDTLTKYSFDRPNKHDDAPDSLAMFAKEIIISRSMTNKVKAIDRGRLGF